jgi:hypothetical protein
MRLKQSPGFTTTAEFADCPSSSRMLRESDTSMKFDSPPPRAQ